MAEYFRLRKNLASQILESKLEKVLLRGDIPIVGPRHLHEEEAFEGDMALTDLKLKIWILKSRKEPKLSSN